MNERTHRVAWFCVTAAACLAGACAKGAKNDGDLSAGGGGTDLGGPTVTSSSSGAPTSSSSSSASGSGGSGGASASSASVGGGTSVSSTSTSSSSSSSSTGGSGGGQLSQGTTVLMAYGGSEIVGVAADVVKKSGFSTPFMETTIDVMGIAFTGQGLGVLVIHSTPTDELHYAFWNNGWNPGFGQPLLSVLPGLTIVGGPAIAGSSNKVHVAYQATDMNFYYAQGSGANWLPKQEAIGSATGPVPPTVAVWNDEPIVAYVGADGDLYDQTRHNNAWSAPVAHGAPGTLASLTPAMVALESGPELVVVYNVTANSGLRFATRTKGVWSAGADLVGAATAESVSIAPMPGGGAVLAYRGLDSHLYTALLSSGPSPSWTMPVIGAGGADPTLQIAPTVARGAQGADAELVYLDPNFTFYQARLHAGVWTAPAFGGAGTGRIALATSP